MNRPSHLCRPWSWLLLAFFCCGLCFIGGVLSRATAQEKPNFGPFETRESGRIIPNDATSIRRVPLTLIGQVETPAAEQVPPAWRGKIVHARMTVGDQVLMGMDAPPERFHWRGSSAAC